MEAHSKPNGEGIKGFFKSNLFAALLIFLLTQAIVIGGSMASFFNRMNSLTEWKGQTDGNLHRMDIEGTVHSHYTDDQQSRDIATIDARLKRVEEDTRHIEVLESEHRRLTNDVEELKRGKK